ncbi:DUF4344 domain-containing metallopeptidase [Streptomyces gobiensis]|uniref:DUF4344 domain-containing metallopeptidase n=1 Tax=Streptomyces gobiensis TaxID=2875706 RepID=UPI001E52147B|nr:DUF4344 domain-containing metallopeptidase [Streptomyces gobiensis]UGY92701.1 DUF4344 domain-containing metallopeptidase [Streptomyces gobiensis]
MPGRYATSDLSSRWPTALGTILLVAFALVCLVVVPLLLVTSGAGADQTRTGSGGFVPEYGKPAGGTARERAFLQDHRVLEEVSGRLNELVAMPATVRMTGRSCGDTEVAYDPERARIDVCYEFVAEVREMFAAAPSAADADIADIADAVVDRKTVGVMTEALYHEAGHALLDKLALPYTGREEDVADQFAAYSLIPQGKKGQAAILAAAENYELYAEDTDPRDVDFAGPHAADAVRAVNYHSYLYGSDPKRYRHLVGDNRLSEDRAGLSEEEYDALRHGWDALLRPHLTRRDQP